MSRIVLLPSAYWPSVGGVEELTRHLALSLVSAGDSVEVWTCGPDDRAGATVEIRDGLVVRRFPFPLPATNFQAISRTATIGPRTIQELRRAVAAFRPDLLHVQCFGPNGAYATALARLTGIPLVVTLQGETVMDDTDLFDVSRVMQRSLRAGLHTAAAVTACSSFTMDDSIARFGLEPGRGIVIPNAVVLEGVEAEPDSTPGPLTSLGDTPYVLALGRVVEKKGFDLLLAGYAAMDPAERTADLVIGGSGAAMEDLEAQAEESGVADRIHFVGRLTREQVATAMAGATVFVMPSRLEPFGIVALEGWRAETAVVATSRGGAPEFIRDGTDGFLVDPFDTAAVARVLATLLNDAPLRQKVAAAGRARVEEFTWPIVTEQYRTLYRSVLDGRSARQRRKAG